MPTTDTVEILLNRFFPSNLLPWFEEGSSCWDTLSFGFDSEIKQTVSAWELQGFVDFPIWVSRNDRATLALDHSTGRLVLSIHPQDHLVEQHLAFLHWCASRS